MYRLVFVWLDKGAGATRIDNIPKTIGFPFLGNQKIAGRLGMTVTPDFSQNLTPPKLLFSGAS
jgi:hypothetical protein